ncbi:hypothetical protein [Methylobacterium oryzae]|uniref:Uncharacterized protein n=1 Tax=Methylobacterium oryzae TaxID=334852 RepID=A0ABU7TYD7_9HYPH
MAFRADEAALRGFERARSYLIPRQATSQESKRAEEVLRDIVERCGPVVEGYPSWHPLVAQNDRHHPDRYPSEGCGYKGLDHTVYFAHGFITCPYHDGRDVLDSVRRIVTPPCAHLDAEELDVTFYNSGTKAILVSCEWLRPLEESYLIPKSVAVPLMLEQELPVWRWSKLAETWETMRPYLLGEPYGNRSSLFVGQDTALALKKIYLSLVESGMFGPMK